ncbi:nitrogenase-stabilizing/protective protein NifW [Propionivibrio soli]|jgi:nitrogenase-stabilizing/protective protein|uniref:nitrogenase-stabilizing/protective protein NifW n=1 Tax=Propionivibrio soli TaxID=2976531 RepID=UPI0021E88CE2|nr:nitrogenase-stabilizing/protective protein NifW [Propionivibrio soli]
MSPQLESEVAELESAEDFLEHFSVAYDPHVVQVYRLHILQRFHDYLSRSDTAGGPTRDDMRASLALAYDDFVRSDARTEKVFRVFKRAAGITTIPVANIGRMKH